MSYLRYHSVTDVSWSQACTTDKRALRWSSLALQLCSFPPPSRSPVSSFSYNVVMPCPPACYPARHHFSWLTAFKAAATCLFHVHNHPMQQLGADLIIVLQMYHQNRLPASFAVGYPGGAQEFSLKGRQTTRFRFLPTNLSSSLCFFLCLRCSPVH